tara:strand:- start:2334 stop:3221 length:888 start_codon:yes stop_codon:yes gene_type:complete
MLNLKAGGVPEHFNTPWNLVVENNTLDKHNISLSWQNCHGGTGEMTQALRSGELDIAVLLTEGITADILHGCPAKIVQFFVTSPLRWGIHTKKGAPIHSQKDLEGKKYAISRYKSGSHLMAYVNAVHHNLNINEDDFVVIKNLDGAREALANGEADIFFWEKFTTAPYVDNGEFDIMGECPTPWPCFVVAVRDEVLEHHPEAIENILCAVNEQAKNLKASPEASVKYIANRFGLKEEETKEWFNQLTWNIEAKSFDNALEEVKEMLALVGVLTKEEAQQPLEKIRQYVTDYACAN